MMGLLPLTAGWSVCIPQRLVKAIRTPPILDVVPVADIFVLRIELLL